MSHLNPADTAFVLICAALVAIMTPGLAFFYGGLVHRRNVITIMMQSFVSMGVVSIIWFLFGFSLAFGPDHGGLIGDFSYVCLRGVGMVPNVEVAGSIPFIAFFVFQLTVAALTPALITGAFADRMRFGAWIAFLSLWSIVVYVPLAHWVWGGGFLQQWGVADFGGGLVVHASAGFAALASVFLVKKRTACPDEGDKPSSVPLIAIGLALLWFGWLGDNPGAAFKADGVAAQAFANTFLAGGLAMCVWLLFDWIRTRKAGMVGALTGVLAGLVAVTPGAGFLPTWGAVVTALLVSAICYGACRFRQRRQWDDSLDVWGVHGIGGITGTLMVGVLAVGSVNGVDGLVAGDARQLGLQAAGVAITVAFVFVLTAVIFKVVDVVRGLHVPHQVQVKGLDQELHGESAYDLT
jgi:ammonium transporter, Amt family